MELFFSEQEIDQSILNQIIRPNRQRYNDQDLGPISKQVGQTKVNRKDSNILNGKGLFLKCSQWIPQNSNNNLPICIYMHGNAGCRIECLPLVNYLLPKNIGLCSFDFSGCGNSQGDNVTLGIKEVDDLRSIIINLNQQGYSRFLLWGRSMGGVVAIQYCSQYPEGILGLILDSAFSSFKRLAEDFASDRIAGMASLFVQEGLDIVKERLIEKTGYDYFQIQPYKNAKKCTVPALFAFSFSDKLVRADHSQILMKHYGGPKQKLVFQGEHNSFRDNNFYQQILSFLEEKVLVNEGNQQFTKQLQQFQNPNIKLTQNNIQDQLNTSHLKVNTVKRNLQNIDPYHPNTYLNEQKITYNYQTQIKQQIQNMHQYSTQQCYMPFQEHNKQRQVQQIGISLTNNMQNNNSSIRHSKQSITPRFQKQNVLDLSYQHQQQSCTNSNYKNMILQKQQQTYCTVNPHNHSRQAITVFDNYRQNLHIQVNNMRQSSSRAQSISVPIIKNIIK